MLKVKWLFLGYKTPVTTQSYVFNYPENLLDGVAILNKRQDFSTILTQSAGVNPSVVESGCGAVMVGPAYLLPPLSSGGASIA